MKRWRHVTVYPLCVESWKGFLFNDRISRLAVAEGWNRAKNMFIKCYRLNRSAVLRTLIFYRLPTQCSVSTQPLPLPPGSHCECVQWAGSSGPRGEWPAAIHAAHRSSLELYRHTIARFTLETSSSEAQTPHTKCQFAAKLSALSSWFIELGPPFTILSSSGGISIACAMSRYLFKSFSGVKKERKGICRVPAFNRAIVRILNEGTPVFFPPFLKRDGHQINSNELAWGCFQDPLFKNSLIIPPSPGELYWNLANYDAVNLNDDTLLAMPFKMCTGVVWEVLPQMSAHTEKYVMQTGVPSGL